MRLIIEARIEGDDIDPTDVPIPLAVIDRRDDDLEQLGLSPAEGREMLAAVQSVMVSPSTTTDRQGFRLPETSRYPFSIGLKWNLTK